MKHKEIKLTPTPFILKVFYGTPEELDSKIKKEYKGSYDLGDIFKNYEAFVDEIKVDGYPEIIMCLTRITPGLVAHESLHVIFYLNRLIGMKYTFESQEMMAYTIQYLVDEIMKLK